MAGVSQPPRPHRRVPTKPSRRVVVRRRLVALAVLAIGVVAVVGLARTAGVFGGDPVTAAASRSALLARRAAARARSERQAAPAPINTAFAGLTTFRGNATRDYYGEGPLPRNPAVLWRFPATGGVVLDIK